MNTGQFFQIVILTACLTMACTPNNAHPKQQSNPASNPDSGSDCLATFEYNPFNPSEKINQEFGKQRNKYGHWIHLALTPNKNQRLKKIKLAEGYYQNNVRVGTWKFYREDGTLKDSVNYNKR